LSFAGAIHRFGTLFEGEKIAHEFRFRNTGERVVRILSVHSPCGCIVGLADGDRYGPGQLGTLRVVFDSERRLGRQELTIAVRTDEAGAGPNLLRLEGTVRAALAARPRSVVYGNVYAGQEYTARVSLRTYEPIRNVEVSKEGAFLSVEPVWDGKAPRELRLKLRSPDGQGALEGAVTLSYEHAETGRALVTRIPVRIAVLDVGAGR
jgi:hypothetical protein